MIINVTEYLDSTAARIPDRIAIDDTIARFTFAELRDAARKLATEIIALDPRASQPVAVLVPKSANAVVSFLAVLYSGNFYVPLDVDQPAHRLHAILEQLENPIVVSMASLAPQIATPASHSSRLIIVDAPKSNSAALANDQAIASRLTASIDTDPIYVKFTSGSTGIPKGVVLPHRAIIDYVEWAKATFALNEDDVIGNQVPLHFDVSVQDIYLSMATGATLIIIPERYFSFPAELMEFIAQRGVSFVCWVPSMLVNIANRDVLATADMRALRFVTVCGEVMPTRHFKQWASHAPTARLFNLYGPTETAIASAYYELESDIEDAAPLPIGAPCKNTHILILDEQGSPVIKGSMGELCIRGSGLGLGYWNAPEATRSAYAPNPTHDHYPETIYRTGDLGYLNDKGQIIYIGRKDSQIKYLGYRIELGEIERAALQVDGVEHACVLYDAGTQQIALFYCGPQPLKARDLRRQLLRHLPKYMLPTKCNHLTALPLNANGKIDRKQLRESIAQDECRQFSA